MLRFLLPLLSLSLALSACTGDDDDDRTGQNGRPTAPTIRITPEAATTADDLTAEIVTDSADPEGDTVTYVYRWSKDDAPVAEITGATVPAASTTKGETWKVEVVPTDPGGEGASATAVRTIDNAPPSVTVTIEPATVGAEDDFTAVAVGDDADGDDVTFTYRWTVDGAASGIDKPEVLAIDTTNGQRWEVTVTPNDGEEDGTPGTAVVVIGNSAPTLESVTISPDPASTQDDLTAVLGPANDPEGDTISFTYAWSVDGTVVQDGPSDALLAAMTMTGQRVTVTVTPSDGVADGAPVTSPEITIENGLPTIMTVEIAPNAGNELTEFLCTALDVTDPDGDTVTLAYQWYVENLPSVTTATITGVSFDRGQSIQCGVTPSDPTGAGTEVRSVAIGIGNAPPSAQTVDVLPLTPREADVLTAVGGGWSDPDGDPENFSYVWMVNGVTVSNAATIDGTLFDKGDSVVAQAIPNDGTDVGPAVTSTAVVVLNTIPSLASATIGPTPPISSTDLTILPVGWVDPDPADPEQYAVQWFVDNVQIVGQTGVTLPAANFVQGNDVYAIVTPIDNEANGLPITTPTITIQNSPPTAAQIHVEPAVPTELDDLTCVIDVQPVDADGDAITIRYEWAKDGVVEPAQTAATVLAADINGSEAWTCRVIAQDSGGLESDPAIATVLVSEACGGLMMDGVTNYGSATASPTLAYGNTVTVEAWVYWDGVLQPGVDSVVFTHRPSSEAATLGIFQNDLAGTGQQCAARAPGQPFFAWTTAAGDNCLNGVVLPANRWAHIAGVYDSGTARLFVNGELVASTATALAIAPGSGAGIVGLGGNADGTGALFSGQIAEVRVSANARYAMDFVPELDLATDGTTVLHWQLMDGAGATAVDVAGGHDATLVGAPVWSLDGPACVVQPALRAPELARAVCQFTTRCEPAIYAFNVFDEATCLTQQETTVFENYRAFTTPVAAGRIEYSGTDFSACVAAFDNADCVTTTLDSDCSGIFTGNVPVGQACSISQECTTGNWCNANPFGACGTCAPRAANQASCAAAPCGDGNDCLAVGAQNLCINVELPENSACGTVATGLCRGHLQCIGAPGAQTCQRPRTLNQTCDATGMAQPACNIFNEQTCENGTCQTVTWGGPGSVCAGLNQCNVNSTCNMTTMTCDALPTLNQACAPNARCGDGFYCDGTNTCRAEVQMGGACTAAVECADGLSCQSSICQAFAWPYCP